MRRHQACWSAASVFALAASLNPSTAAADPEAAAAVEFGTMPIGLGRGELTVGITGIYTAHFLRAPWLTLAGRASALATGFMSGNPGAMLRPSVALGATYQSLHLDVGGGLDLVTFRACGPVNCGRLNGFMPAASARLVLMNPLLVSKSLGISASAAVAYPMGSRVLDSALWTFAAGPVWAFGH